MCGLFGIWHPDRTPVDLKLVAEATNRLRHRGPDDEGYLCIDTKTARALSCAGMDTDRRITLPAIAEVRAPFDLVLGFRRLAIIDVSPAGHQPMSSEDGRYWIVLNGEIYNYVELRQELQRLGYRFHSDSDTEVLLVAYAEWGPQSLLRLVGMFAFAILDLRKRTVFLARDPFGIKPLYYVRTNQAFAFASEIKALLQLDGISRRANPERLYLYLRYGLTDHGAETMFAEIRQIPAAHYLLIHLETPSSLEPVQYWSVDLSRRLKISWQDAADRLRDLFLNSVRLHLRSDVPIGAALSGGIDSSSIVGAMRHVQGAGLDLHTFSHVAEEPAINEETWAERAGRAAGAVIHKVKPTADELAADIERLITLHDEPFGGTSIYAQYRVFGLAKTAGVTVMLDGQGADELLGGYRGYFGAKLASLILSGRWLHALEFVRGAAQRPGLQRFWMEAGQYLLSPLLQRPFRKMVGQPLMPAWLDAKWFAGQGVVPVPLRQPSGRDALREQLYHTLTVTSLPMLLRYEDRDSMAHSIESRVPFLTRELAEFLFALPEEFIIDRAGRSKAILRQAMRGIVPDVILDRQDKIGFATSERLWLVQLRPWVDETLRSEAAQAIPALNLQSVRGEWQTIEAGSASFDFRAWRWLNLIRWADQFQVAFV